MKWTGEFLTTIALMACIGLFPHQQEKVQAQYIPGPEPHGIVENALALHVPSSSPAIESAYIVTPDPHILAVQS